jgi:ribosomal protein L44E
VCKKCKNENVIGRGYRVTKFELVKV